MKKNIIFILIISFAANISAPAQKNKISFRSINTFGLIGGENETSTSFQTVNGIHFSNWFSGVGIGIDNYQYKTLPLFFDLRRYFGSEKKFFVYGDLGYNFTMKDKPRKEVGYYNTYHFKGGIYSDLGIGFKTKFIKKSSLLFSLGYSNKKLQTKTTVSNPCLVAPCPVDYYNYDFSFNRMILKAGLVF